MKNWKYLLVSLVAVLVLMMMGGMALADEVAEKTPEVPQQIERTPVYQGVETGTAKISAHNAYVGGTFYVNYQVSYDALNGVYTINSSRATYDYFAGTVYEGDLYGVSVTHTVSKSGVLKITVRYQTRVQRPTGETEYSERITSSTTIQLPGK